MNFISTAVVEHDALWDGILDAAATMTENEPVLSAFVHTSVLHQSCFEDALNYILADKLAGEATPVSVLCRIFRRLIESDPAIAIAARNDLAAICQRDPACRSPLDALLFYKGFHAVQAHRMAHALLKADRRSLALYLQSRSALVFGIDIHPAASLGSGIMIDHGTGVVIGETSVVEDNVSILQGVTLGGKGKEAGDRHPKVRRGVMIGAGAGIFGNIEIGARAKVGAGSIVLKPVPTRCTVAGVPARLVGPCANPEPAQEMDQSFDQEL
jgi:serine O-acetyltransferase